jgi:flagellar L-ring protein precursor FlgH
LSYGWRIFCLIFPLAAAGCGTFIEQGRHPMPTREDMGRELRRLSRVSTAALDAVPASPGSLWPEDDHVFLYGDRKALREGDTLTIRILESTQASNEAETDLSRSSSLTAGLNTFFGKKKFLQLFKLGEDLITTSSDNAHQGSGSTTRQGQVTATMTAVVRRVLPNGNLIIQGTRDVVVNQEQQFMTITGIVRPQDISRDNVVLSTQVADAKIAIGGSGVVADKQRSGWGTWVFDWLWPF